MNILDLKLYKKYKLDDLIDVFDNGAFRYGQGMVYSKNSNTLVLISKHTNDRIYADEIKDGKILYTGMGQTGDQTITLGNKRLVNAKTDNTVVYMFIVYKQNEYIFYGRVSLDDPYYYDIEPDQNGNNRRVLKFPLTFVDAFAPMSKKELQNTITSGFTPVINVVGACITNGDKYLVAQRSSQQGYQGKWEFPGGKVNDGESDIDAVKREIQEELGVEINVFDQLDSSLFYEKQKDRIINLKVFTAIIAKGNPAPKEGQTIAWKNIDELENLDWMPSDVGIVQTLIDRIPKRIVGTIDFAYREGRRKTPRASDIKRECQDYEKSQKRKAKSGEEAELAVMNYEANKLIELGRVDLMGQIKQVSKVSSDYGYDILSFDLIDGQLKEIHIEVKSATYAGNSIEFFISQAELRNCIEDENYKIYTLLRFGKNYKLHIVKREEFISDNRYLSPITYKVSIPVESF